MSVLNFYPGPSKVHPRVGEWMQDAFASGILGMNHRSEAFMQMLSQTLDAFRSALNVPEEYRIYFVSSATECWEIIAQSLVKQKSLHVYNGAFGEKWKEYTQRIHPLANGYAYDINEVPYVTESSDDYEVLCITHCETSNGTEIPSGAMQLLRKQFQGLIAVDATSSMAGVSLPWLMADVWFASVQKCFGLPPGLGVMVVSPQALAVAKELQDRRYYNSLLFIEENFRKLQTPYTPNSLGIYLLGRSLTERLNIEMLDVQMSTSADETYAYLTQLGAKLLVANDVVRSRTVIPFLTESVEQTKAIKRFLLQQNILIGNGYGAWKNTSLRIANFPAIEEHEKKQLQHWLTHYFNN